MHIHALLKARAQRGQATFIVQIGAMDGRTHDPVYPFLMRHDWPALLVEPVADHFRCLQYTYASRPLVRLANVCIANHDGATPFYRIDPAAIAAGHIPRWGPGASSLYPDRTALGWDHIKPHVVCEPMPCVTLRTLLHDHGIAHFDVLQIDAEGHDFAILRQLDFSRHRPAIINLEIVNLPVVEQADCQTLLRGQGYDCEKTGYDLVAWNNA